MAPSWAQFFSGNDVGISVAMIAGAHICAFSAPYRMMLKNCHRFCCNMAIPFPSSLSWLSWLHQCFLVFCRCSSASAPQNIMYIGVSSHRSYSNRQCSVYPQNLIPPLRQMLRNYHRFLHSCGYDLFSYTVYFLMQ